jgi:hypothetical protein
MGQHQHADYRKHTDAELREGIEKADQELPRIQAEDSEEAVQANREQREAMARELASRQASGS